MGSQESASNSTMARELIRILWRQRMLATPEGLAWMIANAHKKEKDLGPPERNPLNYRWLVP